MKSGFSRTDSSRTVSIKQIETGEATIKKIETEIEALNQQIIDMQSELEKAEKPLREMKAQIRKLGYSDYLNWRTSIGPGDMSNVGAPSTPRPAVAPSPPANPDVWATPTPARPNVWVNPTPATPRPKIAPTPPVKPASPPKP